MSSERLIKKLLREDVEDASKLLGLAINKTQEQLFANLDYEINSSEFIKFLSLVDQRKDGKPFAYIKGSQGFYDNEFLVSPSTLIPRPETELLIETALNCISSPTAKILDLGTGSGSLAVTMAKEISECKVLALDIDPKALSIAKENAVRHGVADQIEFICEVIKKIQT